MKKVIVIGCPGAGKSTFARKLREKTELPLIHLDRIWHRPDRTNISKEEFDARLREALSGEEWIVDGNYARTIEMRLMACDTVFLFDLPTEVCLAGAQARVGKAHDDLPWVEETLDPEFKQWILDFASGTLPKIYELLERYREGRKIVVFHSREEADEYLKNV